MRLRSMIARAFTISGPNPIFFKLSNLDPYQFPSPIELPTETSASPDELVFTFSEMFKMRRMEQMAAELYKEGMIKGFLHLYNGQEAIALGIDQAVSHEDLLITAYRIHAVAHTREISLYQIFCELMGRKDGSSKGKGGSMHFYNRKANLFGGNAIVGEQVPLGVGLGFSLKFKKNRENVAIVMYGDGAGNQGQLYEAANMAALWKLPIVFVCEMNHFAMGTFVDRHSAGGSDFHRKVHDIPGIRVNGQDVFEIREVTRFAKEYALNNGPIILNMITYRYQGHSMSDPGTTYRIKEMDNFWKKEMDPVKNSRTLLLKYEILTEQEIVAIEKQIKADIDKEIEKAKQCEKSPLSSIVEDVYDPEDRLFVRAPNYEDSVFVKENLIQ